MITVLKLENFGRFANHSFNFAPVTVFYGPNEAGKTTLCDALIDLITSPKGNIKIANRLNERYGKDRQVTCDKEGELFKISPDDFENLFCIYSGSISLQIEKNSEWMNKVKTSLFSGGIDPLAASDNLKDNLKSRGKGSLKSQEKELEDELKLKNKEKESYEAVRTNCLNNELKIASAGSRMQQLTGEITELKAEQKKLEESLKQQGLIREDKNLKNILSDITESSRKKEEDAKFSRFNSRVMEELKSMEAESLSVKSRQDRIIALEEEASFELSACLKEKAAYEEKKTRADSGRILASLLRETLVPREKLVSIKTKRVWKKPFIAAALLLVSAALISFFVFSYNLAVFAAILGAALICVAFSSGRRTWEDSTKMNEAMEAARIRWQKESGEDPGSSYEDILTTLNSAVERAQTALEDFKRVSLKAASLEQKAQDHAMQKRSAGNDMDALQRKLRSLLDEAGVVDISSYAAQLARKNDIANQLNVLKEKLAMHVKNCSASGINDLEDIVTRKRNEIEKNLIESELGDSEIRSMENRLGNIKIRLDDLREKNIQNTGSINMDLGIIRGELRGLPEKIAGCEARICEIKSRLDEIKKEQRSIEIAAELFSSLAEDNEHKLEQLSDEIGRQFSSLLNEVRQIHMKSYSTSAKSVDVSDLMGEKRDINHLSAGTRDAFLLAARLTLARRSMDSGSRAVLVLDEPFMALDSFRIKQALMLLKEFRETSSWQLVLFTKDKDLADQALLIFGSETQLHKLT